MSWVASRRPCIAQRSPAPRGRPSRCAWPPNRGKLGLVDAVALHGVQDVVELQAVGDAGVEVVHTVGGGGSARYPCRRWRWRSRPGTRARGGGTVAAVFAGHVVQRVLQTRCRPAFRRARWPAPCLAGPSAPCRHSTSVSASTYRPRSVCHQAIGQLGVQVQRLVGGDGPGGGGPDHGKRVLRAAAGSAEGRRQCGRVVRLEGHVQRLCSSCPGIRSRTRPVRSRSQSTSTRA